MTILRRFLASNIAVFLFVAAVHGLMTRGNAIVGIDTTVYVAFADQVRAGTWNGVFDSSRVLWTKTIYIALLAAARAISSVHWPLIMVAVNVLCSAATAVLLVAVMRRATSSVLATAVALAFYVAAFDIFTWVRWVLTDTIYTLAALAVFVLVAIPILDPAASRRYGLLTIALLFAVFSRPPGLVLVALTLVAALWFWPPMRLRRGLLATMLLVTVVVVGFRTYIVHDPGRWPVHPLRQKIHEFAAREKSGEVIFARQEAFRPPARTFDDHLVIQADRFARFFQVTAAGYSRAHNLYNLLYYAALYLLAVIGVAYAARRDLVRLTLLWFLAFAVFHAITLLDYDWRFRTPVMPQLIVLAALGAEVVLQRVTWWRTSSAARAAFSSSK
jgi:hypothetical protein